MAYFLAASLVSLRNEINAAHPRRDKASDGWVGDTAHAARKSDHNPDYAAGGIVRAIDVDKDGIDVNRLLQVCFRSGKVEYVIWNYGIYTRQNGFRRAAYNGSNPHDKHVHISIMHTAGAAAAGPWGYSGGAAPAPAPAPGRVSTYEVARQVIAGQWGNNPDRANKLRAAGYDPNAVQAEVNRILAGGGPPAPAPAKKTINQIAREVIAGAWGNNPTRSTRLQQAGYSPTQVQAEVNRILAGAPVAPARLSVGVLAQQVIAGQWGVMPERERRITAAGYDYEAVRAEVNRRLA